MKTRILFIVLILSACLMHPALSYSFENEPDGFMGLKWGAQASAIEGMVEVRKAPRGKTVYKRENQELKLGPAALTYIYYTFSPDGRLEDMVAGIKDYNGFLALKKDFIEKYGAVEDPVEGIEEKYIWSGETTVIYISYNAKSKTGVLYAGAAKEKDADY